jgi:hypothetical protein
MADAAAAAASDAEGISATDAVPAAKLLLPLPAGCRSAAGGGSTAEMSALLPPAKAAAGSGRVERR